MQREVIPGKAKNKNKPEKGREGKPSSHEKPFDVLCKHGK